MRVVSGTYRPPHGTNMSALNRKCAELRKSVPSATTSPAGKQSIFYNSNSKRTAHTRELDVLVLHTDKVTVFGQLAQVEMRDRHAKLGEPDELLSVNPYGISKDTAAVDNRDGLVGAKQDLI
jgi:hypothetical protein